MSLIQLLHILWARRGLVILVTVMAVSIAVAARLTSPRKYVAISSVVVDARGVDPITGTAATPAPSAASVLATQADVIASRTVALKVADALAPRAGSGRAISREDRAAQLLGSLSVKPMADSNVIKIKFEHFDPVFAARAANAFVEQYLQTNLELKLEPARRQRVWFEEQLQSLRGAVESRRQSLTEYQQSEGLTATDERLDVETSRLDEISKQLTEAQRMAQEAQARLTQANHAMRGGRLQELPDILSNSLLQTIKSDLVRAEGKLADMAERYGKNHPQYMSAAAEARVLKDKLAAEIRNAQGSISQAAQIAQQQTGELQRAFDRQKARILELRQERDELSVRSREVDNAQSAYDAALQRAGQVRMESQLDQASVAILDRATPPRTAAPPGLMLSTVLAAVFGGMLGAALAVLLELLGRRVRTGADANLLTGFEVLAEVPHLHTGFRRRYALR